jgi:hypothetical protein
LCTISSAPNFYDTTTVTYFLGRLKVIGSKDYVPTVDDILRMRVQVLYISIFYLDLDLGS